MTTKNDTRQAEMVERVGRAHRELEEINDEIIAIADSLQEEKMREGLIYIRISRKDGTAYPGWAVLLYSNTNRKAFSKSLGSTLTKKAIRQAHNGKRMQKLLLANSEIRALTKRRKQISSALKSAHMRLAALYRGTKTKKKATVRFV